jgi:Metallo-peptidase family M12/Fibronectin type III domain/Putative binding domain, N-terminal
MLHFEGKTFGSGIDARAFSFQITIVLFILLSSITVFFSGNISFAQNLPEFFQQFAAEKAAKRADTQLPSEKITGSLDLSLIHPEKTSTNKMVISLPGKMVVLVKDRIERRREDNYTWIGTVEGRELSTVVMSVVNGSLYGHIDMEGETYSLKPENGAYVITKDNPSTVLPFEDDVMIPSSLSVQSETLRNVASAPSYAYSEDGSAIDVLVLYTQQMQAKYGTGLNSKIQNFIDLANTAYAQSGVNTRLRLAHAELYSAASAAEGISISNALQFITNDSQAASLRDTHAADLVSLMRVYDGVSSSCGIAWLMTGVSPAFDAYAFSVVEVRSASEAVAPSYYYCDDRTFAHELGHNMGCHHDRAHAGGGTGSFPYSFGYDHAGIFGTIMSYVGPRVTYFSTPLISYSGIPIGVDVGQPDAAYNVLSINNTRTTVANFRLAGCNFLLDPITASFGPSEGSGSVTVTASDSSCEWSAKSNVPWVTITSADSATGSGMVTYTVSNNTGSQRTGTLAIAGQTFTITQGQETTPPAGSIVINSGAAATRSVSVTLTLDATDASGVSQMCISNTTACSSWVAYTVTKSWTLPSGSGTKTVYVWFRDKWGNQNASPFSTSIILDTTAPSNGTVVPTAGNAQVTLNWSGFADAGSGIGGYKVVFFTGSTAPSSCATGTLVPGYDGTSSSYTHTGLTNGTTYSYRVCAVDKAGNSSSGATASAKPISIP